MRKRRLTHKHAFGQTHSIRQDRRSTDAGVAGETAILMIRVISPGRPDELIDEGIARERTRVGCLPMSKTKNVVPILLPSLTSTDSSSGEAERDTEYFIIDATSTSMTRSSTSRTGVQESVSERYPQRGITGRRWVTDAQSAVITRRHVQRQLFRKGRFHRP